MNYFFVNHVEALTFSITYIEDLFQDQQVDLLILSFDI